jgi:hypothetical protein
MVEKTKVQLGKQYEHKPKCTSLSASYCTNAEKKLLKITGVGGLALEEFPSVGNLP